MYYFQHHIGDYASHTRHLEPMEDLAYRRILDLYYLHERPVNADPAVVARQVNLRDYVDVVRSVLEEFFELTDDGFRSTRADREIERVLNFSKAGKRGAEKRWANSKNAQPSPPTDDAPDGGLGGQQGKHSSSDGPLLAPKTHDPIPNTQEKEINKEKPASGDALADAAHPPAPQSLKISPKPKPTKALVMPCPANVTTDTWQAFLAQRNLMKAVVTPNVIQTIESEARKAGWSLEQALREIPARGWRGFKAEWVTKEADRQVSSLMRGGI